MIPAVFSFSETMELQEVQGCQMATCYVQMLRASLMTTEQQSHILPWSKSYWEPLGMDGKGSFQKWITVPDSTEKPMCTTWRNVPSLLLDTCASCLVLWFLFWGSPVSSCCVKLYLEWNLMIQPCIFIFYFFVVVYFPNAYVNNSLKYFIFLKPPLVYYYEMCQEFQKS